MPLTQYHSTLHSPAGLWQFNGDLTDVSGNGYNLTVSSGTARYTEILPGLKGLQALTPLFIYNTTGTALQITGDMTIEALIQLNEYTTAPFFGFGSGVGGGFASNNTLYQVSSASTSGGLTWSCMTGSNAPVSYTVADRSIPLQGPCHFAATRTSNVIQFYLNGLAFGAASTTLTAPTGGGAAIMSIGSAGVQGPNMWLASLKVIPSALTSTQVLNEYRRTLGTFYG